MRLINAQHAQANQSARPLSMRCPKCLRNGTFEAIGVNDIYMDEVCVGSRRCPNPECNTHVFIVRDLHGNVALESYPPEIIDFDSTNVPARVTSALSEAITCHATECYIAAAIMVRKTLEVLCEDRGATGSNLRERIQTLGTKVVLPQELLSGMDDLRLLGNDAAHVESREYDTVGREEVEVGIELAKEILKATYQMSELVDRLKALKTKQP